MENMSTVEFLREQIDDIFRNPLHPTLYGWVRDILAHAYLYGIDEGHDLKRLQIAVNIGVERLEELELLTDHVFKLLGAVLSHPQYPELYGSLRKRIDGGMPAISPKYRKALEHLQESLLFASNNVLKKFSAIARVQEKLRGIGQHPKLSLFLRESLFNEVPELDFSCHNKELKRAQAFVRAFNDWEKRQQATRAARGPTVNKRARNGRGLPSHTAYRINW